MRISRPVVLIALILVLGSVSASDGGEAEGEHSSRGLIAMANGIWLSTDEIQQLPMEGEAWEQLKDQADSDAGTPDLSDQDQMNNVNVLAKALVFARTGTESYRTEVRQHLEDAIDTELGGRTLALGRELAAYVISADLIDLKNHDSAFDTDEFRPWLERCLTEELDGRTLQSTHNDRPNNWGTHAGASRLAAAIYLGDSDELAEAAKVFEGWLGNREVYSGFKYGELSWQVDSENPVGINPKGATKDGYSIDGVIPDDMRRGGTFAFPPEMTNYPWGGLEGATVQAQLLYRQGYDAWNWEDKALLRAAQFLYDISLKYDLDWWAHGDDEWNAWLINYAYGTDFPTEFPAREGKNMGWTDWTHTGSTVTNGTNTTEPPDPGTTPPPDTGTTTPPDNGTTEPPDTGTTTPPDTGTTTPPDTGTSTPPDTGTTTPPDSGNQALPGPEDNNPAEVNSDPQDKADDKSFLTDSWWIILLLLALVIILAINAVILIKKR